MDWLGKSIRKKEISFDEVNGADSRRPVERPHGLIEAKNVFGEIAVGIGEEGQRRTVHLSGTLVRSRSPSEFWARQSKCHNLFRSLSGIIGESEI